MTEETSRKFNKEEINILIAEQLQICIEPVCHEIGEALEALQRRIVDLEVTVNSIVVELREWKSQKGQTIQ